MVLAASIKLFLVLGAGLICLRLLRPGRLSPISGNALWAVDGLTGQPAKYGLLNGACASSRNLRLQSSDSMTTVGRLTLPARLNGSIENLSRLELTMMTIDQLEDYMSRLLTAEGLETFGPHYCKRQIEWAEGEIQKKLTAQKISLMAQAQHVMGSTCRTHDLPGAEAMVAKERNGND